MLDFASDNHATVHPEVMRALADVNVGPSPSYGDDPVTGRLRDRAREIFGPGAVAYPVLIGTGANVISLMAAAPRWGGAVVTDVAHAHTDENGAPERVGGLKLLPSPSTDGRIHPDALHSWAADLGDPHRAQAAVLSLTQSTELGTVYRPEEIKALAASAHDLGMLVHIDGSRLANAAAWLGTGLRELTTDVGVDILSFGAAKNGGMVGEAVIVLDPQDEARRRESAAGMIEAIPFLRKQTMQLASKGRFLSAQLLALLGERDDRMTDPLWLRNASQANAMAARLRAGMEALPGDTVRVSRPTEANAVFATLPRALADAARKRADFYDWSVGETPDRVEARWMCAWDTTAHDVDAFVDVVRAAGDLG